MTIADVPFEQEMRARGPEKRRDLLCGLYARPGDPSFTLTLREIDDWLRAHGIDPETIQITDEDKRRVDEMLASFEKFSE